MNLRIFSHLLILSVILAGQTQAQPNWAQWRGPAFNGSSPAKNLPADWSKEDAKWKTELPGGSGATPIIWGDRIFVSSLDDKTFDLVGMCLDRHTGEVLWRVPIGIGFPDRGRGRNMASPSPVTDGEKVVFSFGTGDVAAVDFEGNILWKRNIQRDHGKFQILFGYHCSPLLRDGTLIFQVLQRDRGNPGSSRKESHPEHSFLFAVDLETGKDLWKHIRPTDAWDESRESYATPIPFEYEGREEILIAGGDCISGHNPENGEEYWRWGTWNPNNVGHWRIVPSPVFYDGLVYVCAPKQNPVFAVKAGGEGELSDDWVEWSLEENTTDVCVPLIYQDRMYVLDGDGRVLTCLDPKTGEIHWTGDVGGRAVYRASPTGADGKIYIINERGRLVVLEAGDEFNILSVIEMGEELCRASMPVTDGSIYIRTGENLYCVGTRTETE